MALERCNACQGTGKELFSSKNCVVCGGTGKRYTYDYSQYQNNPQKGSIHIGCRHLVIAAIIINVILMVLSYFFLK